MKIVSNQEAGKTVLALSGRLDTINAAKLEKALNEFFKQGNFTPMLDLAELDYVSSTGLRVILAAQKLCRSKDGILKVRNASPSVAEVFELTGFSSFLNYG